MNILSVGDTPDILRDLLADRRGGEHSLTVTKARGRRHPLKLDGYDLCFTTSRGFKGDLLSRAEAALVPVILLVDDASDLDAWDADDTPGRPAAILSLADLTAGTLTLAIRSAVQWARAQRAAKDVESLLRITQEAVGAGTWDWDVTTGRVIWADGLYRLFGLEPGIDADDLFRVWHDAVHPDDQEAAMSAATAAMAGLAPLSSLFRIRRAGQGGAPEAWRWISCKGEVIRDRNGAVARLIGINVDVTEQQERLAQDRDRVIAQDLHQNEARFRTYFDTSPDCMFHVRVEDDGRFTYADVNAAGLAATGLKLDQMLGREPLELLGPVKGPEMTEGLRSVVRTGEPFRYEPTWEMEGGTVVYDAVYMPLRDEAGAITAVLGAARNITEARRTEAALHHAQKVEAVGQLAAGVAHDFNNILAVFQACLRLIESEVISERGQMALKEGRAAMDRGKALTDWLIGFVRKTPVALGRVDLNAALEPMGAMLHKVLPPGVRLTQELAPDLDLACADPHELALAVLNLGINARDAMPGGGVLRLTTRNETVAQKQPDGIEPGRYAVVELADTGTGMAPEVLARVLEPFFTTKPPGRGTGLGLSMVYGIVRRAGGGLRIASRMGEGTTVCLYFPADEQAAQGQPAGQLLSEGDSRHG